MYDLSRINYFKLKKKIKKCATLISNLRIPRTDLLTLEFFLKALILSLFCNLIEYNPPCDRRLILRLYNNPKYASIKV